VPAVVLTLRPDTACTPVSSYWAARCCSSHPSGPIITVHVRSVDAGLRAIDVRTLTEAAKAWGLAGHHSFARDLPQPAGILLNAIS